MFCFKFAIFILVFSTRTDLVKTIPAVYWYTMVLLITRRLIVLYILWANIKNVHTNGPKLNNLYQPNTLYVPVGKLYPRADYAGVLIDLNVDKAIQNGHAALNLTDAFLKYNQYKQKLGPDTGAYRNIHFLTLKRSTVQKNLDILTADLYQAQEQYKLPDTQRPVSSPRPTNRHRRDINFDITFDVNRALKTVVAGVVSIFTSPRSLDKIQKSVKKVAFRTSRLESKFTNFTHNMDKILHWMKEDFKDDVDEAHMLASIVSALDLADEAIKQLLDSITPLVQGRLTHNLLDPLQAHILIAKTQLLADTHGLQVIVDQPVDILKCSVTTFATKFSWYALLSIPLVYREESMKAYQFINIPWFHKGKSIQWAFKDGIVAIQPALFPKIENVFVSMEDLDKVCERFNNNFLCHKRINHFPTCQVSLLYNRTQHCSLRIAAPKVRYSFGSFNFLFFQHKTMSLLKCPGDQSFHEEFHGLVNFEEISKCEIITDRFTLLPKSPATSEVSTLIHQTKPVFILTSEWIKVIVAFDNRKNDKRLPDEPDPWKHIDIISNHEEEVRLFGSHTVLIHSVTMFFSTIIILIILSICIMNFLRQTPKYLKQNSFLNRLDSTSLRDCGIENDTALPEEEVFTFTKESPVS